MRKLVKAVAVLLAACMLTGCAAGAAPTSDSGEPAKTEEKAEAKTEAKAEAKTDAAAAEAVSLEFWINGTDLTDADGKDTMWYAIAKKFMEANPDITIDVVPLSADYADLGTKYTFALSSNGLPDLLLANQAYAKQFVEANAVANLDEYYATHDTEKYFPAVAWDTINGAIGNNDHKYTLPIQNEAQGWIYNTAILGQYGLEVPETWEEFLNCVDVLRANNVTPIAFGYTDSWPLWGYWAMFNRYGIDEEVADLASGAKPYTECEAFKKVLARQKELFEHGAFADDVLTCDNTRALNTFVNGGAAMYCASTTDVVPFIEASEYSEDMAFNWGPTFSDSAFEQKVGYKAFAWSLWSGINATKDEKKMEAIYKFFDFVATEEISNLMIDEYGHIPATNYDFSNGKSAFFGQMITKMGDDWGIADQFTNSLDPGLIMQSCYMQANVLAGVQTPEEAMEEFQTVAEQIQ